MQISLKDYFNYESVSSFARGKIIYYNGLTIDKIIKNYFLHQTINLLLSNDIFTLLFCFHQFLGFYFTTTKSKQCNSVMGKTNIFAKFRLLPRFIISILLLMIYALHFFTLVKYIIIGGTLH